MSYLCLLFLAEVAFDLSHIFDLLEFGEDAIELVHTIDLQGGVDERFLAVAAHVGSNRCHVDPDFRNNAGNIADQSGSVTSRDQDGGKIALLPHTHPTHRNEAFTLALAVAANIFAIGAVDYGSFAAADKAHDLVTGQWAAAVSEGCQQSTDARNLQVGR